ncbi:MAG: SDR family oxidoreductase [Gemmatimonadetes bacterium]|nr:SDR family oxidoreductase [Gemmatimonadota bacterium]
MSTYGALCAGLAGSPRRWLVTGVAGFIGSHLMERLLRLGQDVIGLDNFATGYRRNLDDALQRAGGAGRFRLIEGDIRDADTCLTACQGVDFVLHQAAFGSVPRSILDPALYHHVNVDGTFNILAAARDAGVRRLVHASSSSVYGDSAQLPKHEPVIGRPLSPYALTKRVNEEYAELFREVWKVDNVCLRFFNVFGRRQEPRSAYAAVIPRWIRALLVGTPCEIYGDGETTRDFCYIDNVVQANLLAAAAPIAGEDRVFNVGCGEQTTLNELYATIRTALARTRPALADVPATHADFRAGDIRHSLADTGRIRAALGYEPTHLLTDGIAETIEWYVELLSAPTGGIAA